MAALAYIEVTYHLSGCRSLKERRSRSRRRSRLGRQRHLALCQVPGDALKGIAAIAMVAPDLRPFSSAWIGCCEPWKTAWTRWCGWSTRCYEDPRAHEDLWLPALAAPCPSPRGM